MGGRGEAPARYYVIKRNTETEMKPSFYAKLSWGTMAGPIFTYRNETFVLSPPVLRSERSEASVAARGGGYQAKTGTRHRSDISGCKTLTVGM